MHPLQGMIRRGNNLLQVCKQMSALSGAKAEGDGGIDEKVDLMRRVMGVMQHHDAVTGTAKQAVTFDYQERLAQGFSMCESVVDSAYKVVHLKFTPCAMQILLSFLWNNNIHKCFDSRVKSAWTIPLQTMAAKERTAAAGTFVFPKQEFCRQLNLTQCRVSESSPRFVVTAYNPLMRPVDRYVRIPIVTRGYDVFAPDGSKLVAQVIQESSTRVPKLRELAPAVRGS